MEYDERKMIFVECLQEMWQCFASIAILRDSELIERFLTAKERAHRLIAEIEKKDDSV